MTWRCLRQFLGPETITPKPDSIIYRVRNGWVSRSLMATKRCGCKTILDAIQVFWPFVFGHRRIINRHLRQDRQDKVFYTKVCIMQTSYWIATRYEIYIQHKAILQRNILKTGFRNAPGTFPPSFVFALFYRERSHISSFVSGRFQNIS